MSSRKKRTGNGDALLSPGDKERRENFANSSTIHCHSPDNMNISASDNPHALLLLEENIISNPLYKKFSEIPQNVVDQLFSEYINGTKTKEEVMGTLLLGKSYFHAQLNLFKERHGSEDAMIVEEPVEPIHDPIITYQNLSLDFINATFQRYVDDDEYTPQMAQKDLGLKQTDFYKRFRQFNLLKTVIRCDSGKGLLDETAKEEIRIDARRKGSEGNSICDRNDFTCYMQRFVRATWKRTGSTDWAIRDFSPSASWITKHLTEFFPELVDAGDTQNRQRLKVRINCKAGIQ